MLDPIAHCRRVQAAVAPELTCQIHPADSLPLAGVSGTTWQGFAAPLVNARVAEALGLVDPIPAIVINVDIINREAPEGLFAEALTSVFLHELGHVLPAPVASPAEIPLQTAASVQVEVAKRLTNPPAVGTASAGDCESHDAAWCRRAVHLWVRAEAAGYPSPLEELFGYFGQLSPATIYLPSLAGEAARMLNWTFEEIENTPNPIATLWDDDRLWWQKVKRKQS